MSRVAQRPNCFEKRPTQSSVLSTQSSVMIWSSLEAAQP
jgi:hypothetical protein